APVLEDRDSPSAEPEGGNCARSCRSRPRRDARAGASLNDDALRLADFRRARHGPSQPAARASERQFQALRLRYFEGVGSGAVKPEQQGFATALYSISSTRVPSGSYRFACHLPSRPMLGPSYRSGSRSSAWSRVMAASMFGTARDTWFSTPS